MEGRGNGVKRLLFFLDMCFSQSTIYLKAKFKVKPYKKVFIRCKSMHDRMFAFKGTINASNIEPLLILIPYLNRLTSSFPRAPDDQPRTQIDLV